MRTAWLERFGLHRPELRAWAMYDWANSAMVTTVVTAVFPVYYRSVLAADLPDEARRRTYALTALVVLTLAALTAPFAGALGDRLGAKKRLLAAAAGVGALAVAGMVGLEQGAWRAGLVLFGLANMAAILSVVFYDALLPHVARPAEMDRVSTAGFALGYLGGGLLLGLQLWWIAQPERFGLPAEGTLPTRLAFLSVAVWWALFTVPLLRRVREPERLEGRHVADAPLVRATARQVWSTLRALGRYRQAMLMLLAFLIYNDGIVTIIRFATLYGDERGLPLTTMVAAILVVQFIGVPCSFLFGGLAGRIGTKRAVLLGIVVYLGVAAQAVFLDSVAEFWVLAVLVGLVQGGTQALSRSLFASMIPKARSGEFFGLFTIGQKFAGILGPALFYLADVTFGSSRAAIGSVAVFFVAGGLLLTRVDVEEGRRRALES